MPPRVALCLRLTIPANTWSAFDQTRLFGMAGLRWYVVPRIICCLQIFN